MAPNRSTPTTSTRRARLLPAQGIDGALLHVLRERRRLDDAGVVIACPRLFNQNRFRPEAA